MMYFIMPKTRKKFNWEVYNEDGEFQDIISMTRHEMKSFISLYPKLKVKEIEYTDNDQTDD